jgi:hypothetical protein
MHGGIAKFRDLGWFSTPDGDRLDILTVEVVSPTEGQMTGTIGGFAGDCLVTLFLSSAGD